MGTTNPGTTRQAPTSHTAWTWSWGGAGVLVTGGTTTVSTTDLDALATALRTAATQLDTAQQRARTALLRARALTIPHPTHLDPAHPPTAGLLASTPLPASLTATDAATAAHAAALHAAQLAAVAELEALTTGTGSPADVADHLEGLAADVTACASAYEAAEQAAGSLQPAGAVAPTGTGMSTTTATVIGGSVLLGALLLVAHVNPLLAADAIDLSDGLLSSDSTTREVLTGVLTLVDAADGTPDSDGGALDTAQDALQAVDLLLDDPGTAAWVREDLAGLLVLAWWAKRATTGQERAAVERAVAQAATRLDPWVTSQLPATVQVGSRLVPTTTLTPMQRLATHLAVLAERSAATRYGEAIGTEVTARGPGGDGLAAGAAGAAGSSRASTTVRIPPATTDPFALATTVPALAALGAVPTTAPASASAVIRATEELQHRRRDQDSATIALYRTTHADGTRTWYVLVPGTTDWGMGSAEPQDLLTNLQGVGGRPTDMESAVVTAMRQAGVRPDEAVGLYGHSQGALTAANIAADPAVRSRFTITNLLTAGGPTAGAHLPASVATLHLENTADAVPALDAAGNPDGPHRATVHLDTQTTATNPTGTYPHSATLYADAARGLEEAGEPGVEQWSRPMRHVLGIGEEGARTEQIVFDVNRVRAHG